MASVYGRWVETPVLFFAIWHNIVVCRDENRHDISSFYLHNIWGVNPSNYEHAFANMVHFLARSKVWLSSVC